MILAGLSPLLTLVITEPHSQEAIDTTRCLNRPLGILNPSKLAFPWSSRIFEQSETNL